MIVSRWPPTSSQSDTAVDWMHKQRSFYLSVSLSLLLVYWYLPAPTAPLHSTLPLPAPLVVLLYMAVCVLLRACLSSCVCASRIMFSLPHRLTVSAWLLACYCVTPTALCCLCERRQGAEYLQQLSILLRVQSSHLYLSLKTVQCLASWILTASRHQTFC